MSLRKRVAAIVVSVAALALAAVVVILGVMGINQTVSAGGQATICGAQVDVTVFEQIVELKGISNERLTVGDHVQVNALCVVEVVSIAGPEGGSAARVGVRWSLW